MWNLLKLEELLSCNVRASTKRNVRSSVLLDSDLWVRFSGDCYPSCRCPLQLFRVVGSHMLAKGAFSRRYLPCVPSTNRKIVSSSAPDQELVRNSSFRSSLFSQARSQGGFGGCGRTPLFLGSKKKVAGVRVWQLRVPCAVAPACTAA